MTATLFRSAPAQSADNSMLKRQLMKEIACLERQLQHVRANGSEDLVDLETFSLMIESRQRMLRNLPSFD